MYIKFLEEICTLYTIDCVDTPTELPFGKSFNTFSSWPNQAGKDSIG